jgi:hypothetical protein
LEHRKQPKAAKVMPNRSRKLDWASSHQGLTCKIRLAAEPNSRRIKLKPQTQQNLPDSKKNKVLKNKIIFHAYWWQWQTG